MGILNFGRKNADSNSVKVVISQENNKPSEDKELIPCPKCGKMVERSRVVKLKYICYECNSYFRVKTTNRITMVCDKGTFEPWFEGMAISNPLEFAGYEDKVNEAKMRRRA